MLTRAFNQGPRNRPTLVLFGLVLATLAFSCEGDTGRRGPPGKDAVGDSGDAPPTELTINEDLPGIVIDIKKLSGGTGPKGSFSPGDTMTVNFTVKTRAGDPLSIDALDFANILVSGPTFNYQRVIGQQFDLQANAKQRNDGSYDYTFSTPIPKKYMPPLNDTDRFTEGELQDEPLLAGTYTVGIEAFRMYSVEGESFRDAGNGTSNFLLGGAVTMDAREVVKIENCNQCHVSLRAHGEIRRNLTSCLLCHTAGAEDGNEPTVEGGTPDITIDFKVMIHKIHAGAHLPSVLGVSTNGNGSRNYGATPKPYRIMGFMNNIDDFSHVTYPRFPNVAYPMPRDSGYSSLSSEAQDLEDEMRAGPVNCETCHGDPDGDGPLTAPLHGELAFSQPSRAACGSCHDDVDWNSVYSANGTAMPPQANDSDCVQCHGISGSSLAVRDAHIHPLENPDLNEGTNFVLSSVAESGVSNNDGTVDPGEKIEITFDLRDDAGDPVDPLDLARFRTVVNGPTSNPNLLLYTPIPTAALGPGPSHTVRLPEIVYYEYLGESAAALEVWNTERTPHWNTVDALTTVSLVTLTGVTGSLAAEAPETQNYLDLDGDGALFSRNDFIVLDRSVPGKEEYLQIQWVDGDRLWFSSAATPAYKPSVKVSHAAGAIVEIVTLADMSGRFSLDAGSGTVTETVEFGDGPVVALYTTDFVMPEVYPGAFNEGPDLDESWGEWTGRTIVDGTYTVGLYGEQGLSVDVLGEITSYSATAPPATMDFLVGTANTIEPNNRIASSDNCQQCHGVIQFHGGHRSGYETCVLCHGTAGAADRPRYVAPGAPETASTTIDFRTMLHKIHMGEDLDKPSEFVVNGFGLPFLYPNNFTAHTYEHVVFPAIPGKTMHCTKCHGEDNTAWVQPDDRTHPEGQYWPTRTWRATCGSCHDSDAAQAHIEAQTSPSGSESCIICHGEGEEQDVRLMHKTR